MFPRFFFFVLAGTILFAFAETASQPASWTVAVSELVGKRRAVQPLRAISVIFDAKFQR